MVDNGTLIEGVQERWFEGYMGRHFRGWDVNGKDEKIDRIWTGSKFTERLIPKSLRVSFSFGFSFFPPFMIHDPVRG